MCVRVSVAAKARLRSMHRVVALALPEVVAFDLSIPAQIFGHVSERHRYAFTVCARRPGLVETTTGFALRAEASLDAVRSADTVIVPGFMPLDDPGPAVGAALRDAAARGARIASVCIGAFALAAAGLLDGRQATTHWEHADELAARYPAVRVNPGVLYVDEGQILTSAGVAAGIDLCLHMVQADHGAAAAGDVARRMVAAMHRTGGQAQFMQRPPVEDIARRCGLGTAGNLRLHLAREAATTPTAYRRAFRVYAQRKPVAAGRGASGLAGRAPGGSSVL